MVYAGLDIGSLSSEAVLLQGDEILSYAVLPTGADPQRAAKRCFYEVLQKSGVKEGEVARVVATGYGRLRIPFAQDQVTEITCHAKGAHFLFPNTRTVIDIGGQDSKVITLDEAGRVTDFVMNDKCAAGTGRFLEVMAQALEMGLEEMAEEAAKSKRSVPISSMCTVFAESEVISLIAEGHKREEIIGGLHRSVAERIFRMSRRLRVQEEITFTGGVAKNRGIVKALEKLFKLRINVPFEPQIVGALGAALVAREKG